MKNKFYVMSCIFLCFMLLCVSLSYSESKKRNEEALRAAALYLLSSENGDEENPKNLLDGEYGSSEYFALQGDVRLDVERVEREKYFISYSWANYDLSNLCFYVFAENEKGEALADDENIFARCSYGNDETQRAFYCGIEDYPSDDPLKYKKRITARFLPIPEALETLELTVVYNGKEYIIKDIPLK